MVVGGSCYCGVAVGLVAVTEYRIRLPYTSPPMSLRLNSRPHWAQRAKDTREVRTAVARLARYARIPKSTHLTVQLLWAPGDNRRRDNENFAPMFKSCCDALARGRKDWIGLELVPDDTPRYMTKLRERILTKDECSEVGMWLVITTDDAVPE